MSSFKPNKDEKINSHKSVDEKSWINDTHIRVAQINLLNKYNCLQIKISMIHCIARNRKCCRIENVSKFCFDLQFSIKKLRLGRFCLDIR